MYIDGGGGRAIAMYVGFGLASYTPGPSHFLSTFHLIFRVKC